MLSLPEIRDVLSVHLGHVPKVVVADDLGQPSPHRGQVQVAAREKVTVCAALEVKRSETRGGKGGHLLGRVEPRGARKIALNKFSLSVLSIVCPFLTMQEKRAENSSVTGTQLMTRSSGGRHPLSILM